MNELEILNYLNNNKRSNIEKVEWIVKVDEAYDKLRSCLDLGEYEFNELVNALKVIEKHNFKLVVLLKDQWSHKIFGANNIKQVIYTLVNLATTPPEEINKVTMYNVEYMTNTQELAEFIEYHKIDIEKDLKLEFPFRIFKTNQELYEGITNWNCWSGDFDQDFMHMQKINSFKDTDLKVLYYNGGIGNYDNMAQLLNELFEFNDLKEQLIYYR